MQEESKKKLMVTIRCITYNHEPYIRQCLEGFIMQKTNFRFEAVVHDDASTDGTANIIREYAEKYPDIIKTIYETENQYSKHDGSLSRIMDEHTHGKYIAFCEGDDYWTDPLKLQKQVDFLESHPEYSMCFHNAEIKNETGMPYNHKFNFANNQDYNSTQLFSKWIVPTASIICKKHITNIKISHQDDIINGDLVLILKCAARGKVYGMKESMSVYRVQSNSIMRNPKYFLYRMLKYPDHLKAIKKNFPLIEKTVINTSIKDALRERSGYQKNIFKRQLDKINALFINLLK